MRFQHQQETDFERAADQALDEALAATFPCSDPIAVSCLAERIEEDLRAAEPMSAEPQSDSDLRTERRVSLREIDQP